MKKKLHFLSALLVAMLLIPWQLNAQVLSENFDNLDSGVPTGWVVEGNAGSSYNWQVTGYSYPGYNDTKGLWFNSYDASNGATAVGIASSLSSNTAFAVGNGVFNGTGVITRSNALEVTNDGGLIVPSTSGNKKFKITVDDSGTISATEIV